MNKLLKVDFLLDYDLVDKPLDTKFLDYKPSANDIIIINNKFYHIKRLFIINENYVICLLDKTNSYGMEIIQHYLKL